MPAFTYDVNNAIHYNPKRKEDFTNVRYTIRYVRVKEETQTSLYRLLIVTFELCLLSLLFRFGFLLVFCNTRSFLCFTDHIFFYQNCSVQCSLFTSIVSRTRQVKVKNIWILHKKKLHVEYKDKNK